jgi:hypothetical protein
MNQHVSLSAMTIVRGRVCALEDGDVVLDFGPVALGDTLGDPDHIAHLLLLQLDEGVEDAEVELVEVGLDVQLHLILEELVLERLLAGVDAAALEERLVVGVVLAHLLHLVVVVGARQPDQPLRVELPALRVQLRAVILSQLGVEAVDGDYDRAAVRLELKPFYLSLENKENSGKRVLPTKRFVWHVEMGGEFDNEKEICKRHSILNKKPVRMVY